MAKIERLKKNHMRNQLEEVLDMQKGLEKKIKECMSQTDVDDYQKFWETLLGANNENMRTVTRFMTIKCNR
ncbi:MAG: hypothetical protein ACOX0E_04055 [Syntrophomonadaceae bacterium]|jgi:hypothetical protein